jgi:hypothetical protein
VIGGSEPLIERSGPGSHEERFWLLHEVVSLLKRAALQQPLLVYPCLPSARSQVL